MGVSILLEQSAGAEGNLLFLGAQWADKRKGTSQITLLMAISIGCACTGDLTKKKKGHSFLLQTAQFFPFFKAEGKTWPFYLAQNEKPLKPLWWQLMGKADRFVLSEGDIPQLKGCSSFTSSLGAVSPILEETVMQRRRRKVPCRH